MERQAIPSQIFIFKSLLDLTKFVDENLELHKSELSRYEEELGQMLRQAEQDNSTDEWVKEIKSKLTPEEKPKSSSEKVKVKEHKEHREKKEKSKDAKNWVNYKDLRIFTGKATQGMTEVYFEAVNELKVHIDKLNSAKEILAQLANAGISHAFYLVYIKNGIPEKLVFIPQGTREQTKFEFRADFVTENVEVPIESMEV